MLLYTMTLHAYEEAPAVFVNGVVPGDLRDSVRHRVEEVSVDNGTYRFYIDSDFGPFEVASLVMLRERVREQGYLIDGGYGRIKGRTFRISNMGDETDESMNRLHEVLDVAMKNM